MTDLAAFIPSIHAIWFAGTVNRDDALRCSWAYHNGSIIVGDAGSANRVRIWCQNTEQRSSGFGTGGPYVNWLAVWS